MRVRASTRPAGRRSESASLASTPRIRRRVAHIVNRKENAATHTAAFIIPAVGNNKLRHETLQRFMLANDSVTVAIEIPGVDCCYGAISEHWMGYQIAGRIAGRLHGGALCVGGFGFDKIGPLLQIIGSHRVHDNGAAADPLNTGFDRLMISPGVEFTKVLDEANKKVLKFYVDVEVPFYYRVNAGVNDMGSQGQLIAPFMNDEDGDEL
jgi:hypothetical protein